MSQPQYQTTSDLKTVAEFLTDTITAQLSAGKKVLWLIPGGSSIPISALVSQQLVAQNLPLERLTASLTDERYGPVGHPDSNWLQLEQAGFQLPGATLLPVLHDKDLQTTVTDYAATIEKELAKADYRLGFFGIGVDGHTAGILPHSPAVTSETLTAGYDAGKFIRITITPRVIAKLDEAVVYATGQQKWPILAQLKQELSIVDQPAQVLKQVTKLTIFSNYSPEGE